MKYVTIMNLDNEHMDCVSISSAMELVNTFKTLGMTKHVINIPENKDIVKESYYYPVMVIENSKLLTKCFGKGTFSAPAVLYKGKLVEWKDVAFYSNSCKEIRDKKNEVVSTHTFYLGAEYCPRYYGGYSAIGIVADC